MWSPPLFACFAFPFCPALHLSMAHYTASRAATHSCPFHVASLMTTDEVEHVLRSNQAQHHPRVPYHDDYYYQAVLNKATGLNAGGFFPDHAGPPANSAAANGSRPAFLGLEGLGKLPLANVRTPKPLIELGGVETGVSG